MMILRNPLSFFELIERHSLTLPTSLSGARRIQKVSCNASSFWGEFDFTDSDERKLRVHLESIYEGEIKTSFVSNFALRFLNISQANNILENENPTSFNTIDQSEVYPT